MEIPLYLGISAGVLQFVAIAVYSKQIFRGTSVPNTATWTLWAFLGLLTAAIGLLTLTEDVFGWSVGIDQLLFNDDRALAARILRSAGLTVLEAGDPVVAFELVQQHVGDLNLVLTDVVMPRLDGPALARELRQRWPRLAVLFVTGYAEAEAFGTSDTLLDHAAVLSKPFTPASLERAVRRALTTARAAPETGAWPRQT